MITKDEKKEVVLEELSVYALRQKLYELDCEVERKR